MARKASQTFNLDRVGAGSFLWVPEKHGLYQLAEVRHRDCTILHLTMLETNKSFTLDLESLDIPVLKANAEVVEDMTSLRHLHLPGILHNLQERSLTDFPYTFLGSSVLVAVNPLRPVINPAIEKSLGKKSAVTKPHPYAIAEGAFQQMLFAFSRKSKEILVNQSILVSGESGSGKTECSKMVLKHIVSRCLPSSSSKSKKSSNLDRRLLQSTPILEAFGNAATKRNHNSSRFGRFMKLHFEPSKGRGNRAIISGASVETYLLERSRVTSHSEGERGFHVFYELIAGASKSYRNSMRLDEPFEYLLPRKRAEPVRPGRKSKVLSKRLSKRRESMLNILVDLESKDKTRFKELCTALEVIGIPESGSEEVTQAQLFAVVAAILHLGNIKFQDDSSSAYGHAATVTDEETVTIAGKLLGIKGNKLQKLLVERKVKVANEEIIAKRDAVSAKHAVDSVAKMLYVQLFNWLVKAISNSLHGSLPDSNSDDSDAESVVLGGLGFIGVLDIFGFESFVVNDFEQLLINYTNEALQSSFNHQIFEAEAQLYEREGLLIDASEREAPADNTLCIELLQGNPTARRGTGLYMGILGVIDAEGKAPQPLDEKMNAALHRTFKGHTNFVAPHARDARTTFLVKHFAGTVSYTVGHFLEKNVDNAPDEVDALFATASTKLIKTIFGERVKSAKRPLKKARQAAQRMNKSVISSFKVQIDKLLTTLDLTRCSFVRCIKPNPHMIRKDDDDTWFDPNYVINQLENLSIPQTTQVLRGGLPTRIPYDVFVDLYMAVLPKKAIQAWKTLGQGDDRAFVTALFFAYGVETSTYKLGLTRVFFRAGMLEKLTGLLDVSTAGKGALDSSIVDRFRSSFARHLWRKAFAKVRAFVRFTRILQFTRDRQSAVTILQRMARRRVAELEAKQRLALLREERRKQEQTEAKKRAREKRRKAKEMKKLAQEAQARKAREAELLHLQEIQIAEEAEEEERKAKEAAKKEREAKAYREKLEKEEKAARKKEKEEKKKAVEKLGGEKEYKKQVEREQVIMFSDDVVVREYEMYEVETSPMTDIYTDDGENAAQPDDLVSIAKTIKVVTEPLTVQVQVEDNPEDTVEEVRRRSYATPLAQRQSVRRAVEVSKDISADGVWLARENPEVVMAEENDGLPPPSRRGPRNIAPENASKRFSSFKAILGRGASRLSTRTSRARSSSARDVYDWTQCFVHLSGYLLKCYEGSNMNPKTGKLEGVHLLQEVHLNKIKKLIRYNDGDKDQKVIRSAKAVGCSPTLMFKLVHIKHYNVLLRFSDPNSCNVWARAINVEIKRWREEVKAMRRYQKAGGSEAKRTALQLYKQKLITKEDYEQNLAHQLINEAELAQQKVALVGEDNYDRRVICGECREVNFLVEPDENGQFFCHHCAQELFPDGRRRPRVVTKDVAPPKLTSLVEPVEPESINTKNMKSEHEKKFPITVSLEDGSKFTVLQGTLLPKPRFDKKTGLRKFYFSYACQLEEAAKKGKVIYWYADFPFLSFKFLHFRLGKDIESRGIQLELPKFPSSKTGKGQELKEAARIQLVALNKYMSELLTLATTNQEVFRLPSIVHFFNLNGNIQVWPLPLDQLEQLKGSFLALSKHGTKGKKFTKSVFKVYNSVQLYVPRLEATMDEKLIFSSTDPEIASLSNDEKREMVFLAKEFLLIFEDFEARFESDIQILKKMGGKSG